MLLLLKIAIYTEVEIFASMTREIHENKTAQITTYTVWTAL